MKRGVGGVDLEAGIGHGTVARHRGGLTVAG